MAANNKKNKTPQVTAKVPQAAAKAPVTKPVVEQIVKQDNPMVIALKEETLVWLLTIICSIAMYLVIGNVVHSVYHPDVNALKEEAGKILYDVNSVRPEPAESMLFRVGVVVILLGLLGFYRLFSRMKAVREQASKPFFMFLCSLCVVILVGMIWLDFSADNFFTSGGSDTVQNSRDFHQDVIDGKPVSWGTSNFDFFFHGLFLGNNLLLYAFILVPAIACLFFIGVKKYGWGNNKIIGWGVNIICSAVILAIVFMHTFSFPYTFENKYDFNAVYYSMTQVYAGLPLLVNGFTNTYGLYPEFLNPVFRMIGLSVYNFSLVMACLLGAAFTFNFFVLKWFTGNKFLLLAGFMTVAFFPFLDFKFVTSFDCIFALFPIRYIIPSTLAFLSGLYFRKQSKSVYWFTFFIMGFFVLWNPEIGMVCYLCWLAVNTYRDFYNSEGKVAIKKMALHWVAAAGVIVAVVLVYKAIIYLVYHASPDLPQLFGTITVFGKIGFNMLPMTLIHPWNLSVIILITGFTYSVSKWYRKEITAKAAIVFLLSLLGLGYFVYFQGRSHNWPFAYSTSFTILLLTLLGDELWVKIKDLNIWPLSALFVVFLFGISFSFFEVVAGLGKMNELISQEEDKTKAAEEQARIESNVDFILKNSKEHEKIHILTAMQYQGLYFGGTKRIAAFNPGFMDMFLKTDVARLVNTLADSSQNVFIEPALCNFGSVVRPLAAMGATYEVKSANQGMALLSKRKMKVQTAPDFANGTDVLLDRKYTDDTAGVHARINDAFGIKPLSLNASFSVEALFFSSPQVYPYATVVGNMNDSSGFIIASVINSSNYFFGVNGKGVTVPVPANQWVYCAMNIFPDRLDVYVNGSLAGSMPLTAPYRQSKEKVCVGDLGYMRYFVGAISEVAVANKPLDKGEVGAKWEILRSRWTEGAVDRNKANAGAKQGN